MPPQIQESRHKGEKTAERPHFENLEKQARKNCDFRKMWQNGRFSTDLADTQGFHPGEPPWPPAGWMIVSLHHTVACLLSQERPCYTKGNQINARTPS
jgi:hypothetical protein